MAGAYEFALSEWGLSHRRLEAELTDELFVLYLDAAADRLSEAYVDAIEQIRAGYIFAQDQKQYNAWARKAHRGPGTHTSGLVGDALEAAVMSIARQFPDNVIRGTV